MIAGQARHDRPAAADLFHRHPRLRSAPKALPLGESGEIGIAGIGVAEGYLNRPELTQRQVHRRFPGHAQQSLGPHLPHRRPRPHQRRRRDRISRPHRHAGEAARLSHRTDRDRIGAARSRRTIAQAAVATFEPSPGATELVAYYSVKHGAARARTPADIRRASARPPARLHDAGLSGAAAVHPDAGPQQGRPRASCRSRNRRRSASAPPTPSRKRRWSGCCARR